MSGRGGIVVALLALSLGLLAYKTGRLSLFVQATAGSQVINR